MTSPRSPLERALEEVSGRTLAAEACLELDRFRELEAAADDLVNTDGTDYVGQRDARIRLRQALDDLERAR